MASWPIAAGSESSPGSARRSDCPRSKTTPRKAPTPTTQGIRVRNVGAGGCGSSQPSCPCDAPRWLLFADALRAQRLAERTRLSGQPLAGCACARPAHGFSPEDALDYCQPSHSRRSVMPGDGLEQACDPSASARTSPSRPRHGIHSPRLSCVPV